MEGKKQLYDEFKHRSVSLFGLSYRRLFILVTVVVLLGIYLGFLLFGQNSLTQYMKLQDETQHYKQLVHDLQEHNAHLQKDYFELKEIQPK